jgi:hypothetical protein
MSRPTFVYWNLPNSSTAKYIELDKDYPPNNPNTKISDGYVEVGTSLFYKDVELKETAGFINYTDNVLTSTLLNDIPNYIFNMTYSFNFPDGIIQTIGSGSEVVEDFDNFGTWINPILFTIIGGVGAYFGKSGWILRELDQSNDRPIKNLNKWSVFLNETNVINNANPSFNVAPLRDDIGRATFDALTVDDGSALTSIDHDRVLGSVYDSRVYVGAIASVVPVDSAIASVPVAYVAPGRANGRAEGFDDFGNSDPALEDQLMRIV